MFKLDLEKAEEPEIKLPSFSKSVNQSSSSFLKVPERNTLLIFLPHTYFHSCNYWPNYLYLFTWHLFSPWLYHLSEKAMAPHSSTLAWEIPWTEEPGRLQSMGSLRVGHDWVTSLSFFTFMHWRRKWQPTPVFLPGESQGRRSLVDFHLWGCTESDMTDAT